MPALHARLSAAASLDEDGFTLVEQLVTIVILGIGVVAVLGAVLTLISTSARHRDLSNATAALANSAARVVSTDSTWVACATPSSYQSRAVVPVSDLPQSMAPPPSRCSRSPTGMVALPAHLPDGGVCVGAAAAPTEAC